MLYTAPILLTLYGDPIREGTVRVTETRISDAGKRSILRRKYPSEEERFFKETVLMPGLINGHTHLEDGGLRGRLPYSARFDDWMAEYGRKKKGLPASDFLNHAHLGALECLRNGTTTILDTTDTGASFGVLFNERLRSVIFLGFSSFPGETVEDAFGRTLLKAEGFLSNDLSNWGVALTNENGADKSDLFRRCAEFAGEQNVFLFSHGGATFHPPETAAPKIVLVSPWTVERMDWKGLAAAGTTAVLCPRSFIRFGKTALSLRQLLDTKINLCLGTESLAETDSLDLFEEMACLKKLVPELTGPAILRFAVHGGARAMGLSGVLGRIRPGFLADLIGVRTCIPDADSVADALLEEDVEIRFVMVNGREVLI